MTDTHENGGRKSPFLRAQEAADYLGLTRSTLEHYRWIGGGPSYRKHGGLVFYHIDDLSAQGSTGSPSITTIPAIPTPISSCAARIRWDAIWSSPAII
ncbi:MAG: helix-turn-helix transcriptional regulator [Tsuneonella suprasediminis]